MSASDMIDDGKSICQAAGITECFWEKTEDEKEQCG